MAISNICNYSPITNLSIRTLNHKFSIVHRYLCYLAASGGGGGGLTAVATSNSATVSFTGDGTPGDPLSAEVIGGGGTLTDANNGLSLSVTSAVLGQTVGEVGNPALITDERELPSDGGLITILDINNNRKTSVLPGVLSITGDAGDAAPSVIELNDITDGNYATIQLLGSTGLYVNMGGLPAVNISTIGDLSFASYPDSRDNGPTTKALYTDSSGNVLLGGVSAPANSGLSVESGNIVLGQIVGAVGDPAMISDTREIPFAINGLAHLYLTYESTIAATSDLTPGRLVLSGESPIFAQIQLVHTPTLGVFAFVIDETGSHISAASSSIHLRPDGAVSIQGSPVGPGELRLDLAGAIKIVDGSEGLGKILVSDADGKAAWTQVFEGGEQVFTANGVITVVTITHNMNLPDAGGGVFKPKSFSLTTTQPISNNHLNRTITWPTANTMVITFGTAPNIGEDAVYIWTIFR